MSNRFGATRSTCSCNGAKDWPTSLEAVCAHKTASQYQTFPMAMGLTPPSDVCKPMREESSKDVWRGNLPIMIRLTNGRTSFRKFRYRRTASSWSCSVRLVCSLFVASDDVCSTEALTEVSSGSGSVECTCSRFVASDDVFSTEACRAVSS